MAAQDSMTFTGHLAWSELNSIANEVGDNLAKPKGVNDEVVRDIWLDVVGKVRLFCDARTTRVLRIPKTLWRSE